MTGGEAEDGAGSGRTGRARRWWARRGSGPIDRRQVLDALALRPDANWAFRFGLMQALSVIIAVVGLTGDSAAVVIGAMLVAPLMTPLMALAASLAMGWHQRMLRSAVVVTLASGGSVLLAFLLASLVPGDGITEEVLRRTSPGTGDLVVALAAGVAGAYGTVRSDVSASLPGVAVAVALVPPLATIGVTLEAGERGLASGAGLLFVTNLSAIVLAGVCVFLLTGFVPARRISIARGRLLVGATAVAATVALVTVILAGRTLEAARTAEDVATARRLTTAWLGGSGLDLDGLEVADGRVAISVSGPEPPPDVAPLAGQLTDVFGTTTDVEVRWSQRTSISPSGSALEGVDPARLMLVIEDWLTAGGTPAASFTVDVDTDGDVLALGITGPVAAPTSALLELLLVERLGLRVPVLVESTVTSAPDASNAELDVVEATAGRWAAEQGLRIVEVRETSEGVVLQVEGDEPPFSSRGLETAIASALGRTIEVELRYRESVVVPTGSFVWPLDCADVAGEPAAGPGPTVSGGFTRSAAGRWLRARLDETRLEGAVFLDDGASFVTTHADGLLAVWITKVDEGDDTGLLRRVDAPTPEEGPRGAELRAGVAGGARVVAVLVPDTPLSNGPATCLPSSDRLDRWFLQLLASAALTPLPLSATPPDGVARPAGTGSAAEHVGRVGTAAGLSIGRSFAWSTGHGGVERAVIRLDEGDVLVDVSLRYPSDDTSDVRRAGGVTLRPVHGAVTGGPADRAVEALADALAGEPWLGAATG